MRKIDHLVVTCEHGGNRVPAPYRTLFRGRHRLLETHRAHDPGALHLARRIAARYGAPIVFSSVTRLLVELNRSKGHPQLFSDVTRSLDVTTREAILERYYYPYRSRVEQTIDECLKEGARVWHVSVHSFTPVFRGIRRRADIGLLYDPTSEFEVEICRRWAEHLEALAPRLRIRRNYPYRGTADGLTTALRRRFPKGRYAGTEIEVNQGFAEGDRRAWTTLCDAITESIRYIYEKKEGKCSSSRSSRLDHRPQRQS